MPTKFILLSEDDPDNQEILKDVFSDIDNSFILFFVNNGKRYYLLWKSWMTSRCPA